MNNEEARIQAIKRAWSEIQINRIDYNENGWLKIKPNQYERFYNEFDLLKRNNNTHWIRPKSISEIENNNGWTRIETDGSNLPNELAHYLMAKEKSVVIIELTNVSNMSTLGASLKKDGFTHYQKIDYPKPPIY